MEFKLGDLVECIEPRYVHLTAGKIYEIIEHPSQNRIAIINDIEYSVYYPAALFKFADTPAHQDCKCSFIGGMHNVDCHTLIDPKLELDRQITEAMRKRRETFLNGSK